MAPTTHHLSFLYLSLAFVLSPALALPQQPGQPQNAALPSSTTSTPLVPLASSTILPPNAVDPNAQPVQPSSVLPNDQYDTRACGVTGLRLKIRQKTPRGIFSTTECQNNLISAQAEADKHSVAEGGFFHWSWPQHPISQTVGVEFWAEAGVKAKAGGPAESGVMVGGTELDWVLVQSCLRALYAYEQDVCAFGKGLEFDIVALDKQEKEFQAGNGKIAAVRGVPPVANMFV